MAFVVVYDASVLFPSTLRDLLIRIAQSSLVQAKWTEDILDEIVRGPAAAATRPRPAEAGSNQVPHGDGCSRLEDQRL